MNLKIGFTICESNSDKMGLRKGPNVFTEQGVAILSDVLNGETAINVNSHQYIRITFFPLPNHSASKSFCKEFLRSLPMCFQAQKNFDFSKSQ